MSFLSGSTDADQLATEALNKHVVGSLVLGEEYPVVVGWWLGSPLSAGKIKNWARNISSRQEKLPFVPFLDEVFKFQDNRGLAIDDIWSNSRAEPDELKSGFLPHFLSLGQMEADRQFPGKYDPSTLRFLEGYGLMPRAGVLRIEGAKIDPKEVLLGARLAAEGKHVLIRGDAAKGPDAWVDGVLTEFKTATSSNLSRSLKLAKRATVDQGARNIMLDLTQTDHGWNEVIRLFKRLDQEGLLESIFDIEVLISQTGGHTQDLRDHPLFSYHLKNSKITAIDGLNLFRPDNLRPTAVDSLWRQGYEEESSFPTLGALAALTNMFPVPRVDVLKNWGERVELASVPSECVYLHAQSIKLSEVISEIGLSPDHPFVNRHQEPRLDHWKELTFDDPLNIDSQKSPSEIEELPRDIAAALKTWEGPLEYYYDIDYLVGSPLGRVAGKSPTEIRQLFRDMAISAFSDDSLDEIINESPILSPVDYKAGFKKLINDAMNSDPVLKKAPFYPVVPAPPKTNDIIWSSCDAGNPEHDHIVVPPPTLVFLREEGSPLAFTIVMDEYELEVLTTRLEKIDTFSWDAVKDACSDTGFDWVGPEADSKVIENFSFTPLDPGVISNREWPSSITANREILPIFTATRELSDPVRFPLPTM